MDKTRITPPAQLSRPIHPYPYFPSLWPFLKRKISVKKKKKTNNNNNNKTYVYGQLARVQGLPRTVQDLSPKLQDVVDGLKNGMSYQCIDELSKLVQYRTYSSEVV